MRRAFTLTTLEMTYLQLSDFFWIVVVILAAK